MKKIAGTLLAVVFAVVLTSGLEAKETKKEQPRFYRPDYVETDLDIPGYESVSDLLPAAAAADTYCIVWYGFETMDWQGWTRVDNTAQKGTFFHVDDFAGLGGGTYGLLVPLEGTKSLWCGARPGADLYTCSWGSAPGYGNNWDQELISRAIFVTGAMTVSYKCSFDTEPGDYLSVLAGGAYRAYDEIARYSGRGETVATYTYYHAFAATKLRFRFVSDMQVSDEDGVLDTDGACIIDSITVSDEDGLIDFEDFESYEVGQTDYLGIWFAWEGDAYGDCSGIAANLLDRDPCNSNYGSVIMFFNCFWYPSNIYPGLYDTPFCQGEGGYGEPCQDEMIVSPPIDLARYSSGRDEVQDTAIPPGELGGLHGVRLEYAVYTDLPLENLVFRTQQIRNYNSGCPGRWISPGYIMTGEPAAWQTSGWEIGTYVASDTIQVALGLVDMCAEWYGTYGDCAEHTPAPWYDNVRIYRYSAGSPQWDVMRADLFQDTFPQEVEISSNPMEEFCRADMAGDVAPYDDYDRIDPGDSAVVRVSAPFAGGLDTLVTGEARVYCHVSVSFLGTDGKPDLYGAQLEGTYGSYVSDDGDWTVLLCEPARNAAGHIAPDAYCVDMNDSLFTRGYMIEYYFKAFDLDGSSSTYPCRVEWMTSNPHYPIIGSSRLLEFTCLPTLRTVPAMLYVDDFDGRGTFEGVVQIYFDNTFDLLTPTGEPYPDRYDVCGPSSGVSNGIGAYTSVTDASSIFCTAYEIVMYDSGDLEWCTISEGTEHSDKSNDAQLLVDWMNVSEHKVGLLVMGDQVASDLDGSPSPVALELISTICGTKLENGSYFEMTGSGEGGGTVSPVITGVPGGSFDGISYYAFGGCPWVNSFDVLESTGPGQYGLQYPDYGGMQYYAGIFTDQLNNASQELRTVWVGHSYMYIRNIDKSQMERWWFIGDVWSLFGCGVSLWLIDSELPKATSLAQNFPNPFNPVTRVAFSLKKKGHVSMRIYDVSGRLVRVLVDEVREAGSHEVLWDGTNNGGRATASGIYFCRMEADDYQRTIKMVLLR